MKTSLVIFATLLLSLSSFSCYTITRSIPAGVRTQYNHQYFNAELKLNPELLDDWVQRAYVQPAPSAIFYSKQTNPGYFIIRQISFYTTGKVTFYSEFENRNGISHNGRYRLFADTLVVYFDDQTDIEKYLFRIDEDRLTLTGVWKYDYASYTLTASNSSTYDRYQSE